MQKSYNPFTVEEKWCNLWSEQKLYEIKIDYNKTPFSIVIPPPNVTGSLHIGHALNNTLQDILTRYKRMKGFDSLWIPGMDHAGIATQMMVERKLEKEGIDKYKIGREEFIKRVWEWKEESGGAIINQLKRLGALPDWSRQRFTLDEGLSKAVTKVFVDLYNEGLIYRDKRLVNWDPQLRTAISDLEVEQKEEHGYYWHIKYPLENQQGFITVATTRPETMLGDTAVAVHPDDERYRNLLGLKVTVPLCDRVIPVIADEYSDPEKGSGAVKITPAHDFNDFEVGKRHNLEMINILDDTANLNDSVPERFRGLNRFEARKRIVEELESLGLIEKIEETVHTVPYGDRSGVVIEPYLTDQWYVDAKELAKQAIEVVEKEDVKFYPKFWENTYLEWMRNIEPWCISRQLWWGHQIPAWYGPDGHVFVDYDEASALKSAKDHYGRQIELTRDTDVLDTWFSSGLWPFSTMGWPDETEDYKHYFPTSTLITAFDIIFFWVARMIMLSLRFTGKVPFRDVYIHGLIRDENGQKMSKTKGNAIDPIDVIETYGADSLRFSLTAQSSQGRDIKLSYQVIEGYRNFMNKIWNATRFLLMNLGEDRKYSLQLNKNSLTSSDKWILTRYNFVIKQVDEDLSSYEFDKAANSLYQFLWHDFCDWYIEIAKNQFKQGDDSRNNTLSVLLFILSNSLKLLHPITPHITEELYSILSGYIYNENPEEAEGNGSLLLKNYPVYDNTYVFETEFRQGEYIKEVITGIRSIRALLRIHPSEDVSVIVRSENTENRDLISTQIDNIKNLAGLSELYVTAEPVKDKTVSHVIPGTEIHMPVEGITNLDEEIQRIDRDLEKVTKELERSDSKLKNKNFLDRAPQDVVQKEKDKYEEFRYQKEKLEGVLNRLKALN